MPKRWLVKSRWLVVLEATTNTRIYFCNEKKANYGIYRMLNNHPVLYFHKHIKNGQLE